MLSILGAPRAPAMLHLDINFLLGLLADNITVLIWVHFQVEIRKCNITNRRLLVKVHITLFFPFFILLISSTAAIVTTFIWFESKALLISRYTSQVSGQVHQICMVNVIISTLATSRFFSAQAGDLSPKVFEKAKLLIAVITFDVSTHPATSLSSRSVTTEQIHGGRLFWLRFFRVFRLLWFALLCVLVVNLTEHLLVFWLVSSFWMKYELQPFLFILNDRFVALWTLRMRALSVSCATWGPLRFT